MKPMSRALTLFLMLALHGVAWAGPVPAAEADAAPTAAALPSLLPDAAASAATGSALAVEIIKEADAGATTAEAPRNPARDGARAAAAPATPTPSPRNQASPDDDPWGLRDMGKTAVQWVKDAVPWLRSDEDERDAGRTVSLDEADWAGGSGRGAKPGNVHLHATANAAGPESTVVYGDAARPKPAEPGENVVRMVLDVIREVLEHPMTWLVVALFAIGGIVVKKIDRRPTK